jgi:hypothetical protein
VTRLAIADCTTPPPVATESTRSASTNSGDSASTGAAICAWSAASASTTAGGALGLAASASASARRTSGDASSSSISIAPSAAPASSGDKSEYKYARASALVASARWLAGAVRTQSRKSRTIIASLTPRVLCRGYAKAAGLNKRFTINLEED